MNNKFHFLLNNDFLFQEFKEKNESFVETALATRETTSFKELSNGFSHSNFSYLQVTPQRPENTVRAPMSSSCRTCKHNDLEIDHPLCYNSVTNGVDNCENWEEA